MPETNKDMETRKPVVSRSKRSAELMMSGGVMIAANTANKCCKAANNVSLRGGRSYRPYIRSFPVFSMKIRLSRIWLQN